MKLSQRLEKHFRDYEAAMKVHHMSLDDCAAMFVRLLGEKVRPLSKIVNKKNAAENVREPLQDIADAALQMAGFLKWANERAGKKDAQRHGREPE